MSRSSPLTTGFGLIFRRPSLPLAEIAWRWSFAAAAWFLVSIFFVAYLGSLPVNALNRALLRSGQPALIAQALHRIFAGSGFRFTSTGILIALGLIIGWILLASLSRLAIVKVAAAELGVDAGPGHRAAGKLLFLNLLRVVAGLAAIAAVAGSIVLPSSLSASTRMPSLVAGLLVCVCWFLTWISWAFLNWLLSFAAIFAPLEHTTFSSALDLLSRKKGAISLIGIVFGCCHLAAFAGAWIATSTVLGLAGALPPRAIALLLAIIAMAYCALADFFYTGRLAAYVSLLRPEEAVAQNMATAPPVWPSGVSIDKNELILSDVPPLPA